MLRRVSCGLSAPKATSAGATPTARGPIEQNHALASTWVSKAVERGGVRAQGFLGVLYHAGKGVKQDDALAVAWLEKPPWGLTSLASSTSAWAT